MAVEIAVDAQGRTSVTVTRPAYVVVVEVEETKADVLAPRDPADRQRLIAWVSGQPQLLELFDAAMRACDGPDWLREALEE